MNTAQKGFAPILIIIAVAVAVITGGTALYMKIVKSPSSPPPIAFSPTPELSAAPTPSPSQTPYSIPFSSPSQSLGPTPSPTANPPFVLISPFARPLPSPTVSPSPSPQLTPAYTLVAYTGQVFGAKVPNGWRIISNESGIEIVDPIDDDTGVSGIVAVGWFGYQTPDGFINLLLQTIGATNIIVETVSDEDTINDPATDLSWTMKTKTFSFYKGGKQLKAKASAGVLNGYGQYIAMMTAFQTTPAKWGLWAPTLERIAKSITIINPQMAGGAHTVKLPTAADLENDYSPLMEAWEYRNQVGEKTSHEFSDAIMGQETDLVSPSTGREYTLPLNAYDPTKGGYHNPDKWEEILVDPYQR